jgi:nitroimidazol reductase NimA-like FMN-containing flavoprotein (pyridoxamine 5'-phosphate oxidase superfamily)
MGEREIESYLTDQGVGVLSMAAGNAGYGIPLSFGYDGEYLYFVFAGHSEEWRKVSYAEQTETATFLVFDVDPDGAWRSVVVEGRLGRITPDEWDRAREALAENAYRPDLLTDASVQENPRVWALDAAEATGRAVGTD